SPPSAPETPPWPAGAPAQSAPGASGLAPDHRLSAASPGHPLAVALRPVARSPREPARRAARLVVAIRRPARPLLGLRVDRQMDFAPKDVAEPAGRAGLR